MNVDFRAGRCDLFPVDVGETGEEPAPKEQPPRKLSGRRTTRPGLLERGARAASADGITISGKSTEGALWAGTGRGSAVRGSNTSPADPIRPQAARPDPRQVIGVTDLYTIGIGPSNSPTIGPMRALAAIAAHLALRRDEQHIVSLDRVIEIMRHMRQPGRDTRSRCGEASSAALPVDIVQR